MGQITQIDLVNGASTFYEYWGPDHGNGIEQYGKLWQISTKDASDLPIQQLRHTWDNGGNLLNREDVISGDLETFSYDPLDRLETVTATGGSGGEPESYGKIYRYSPIGNIVEMNGKMYSYDSERPHAVTSVGTATYDYDANGNMTWRGSENQSIAWNVENMPSTISGPNGTATFVYDGDGNRVIKVKNGEAILYVNQYYEKNLTTGEETTYYYLGGRRIAFKKGDDLEYTHEDHLTGTSLTTDSNGNEMATVKYFPYGTTRLMTGDLKTDKLFTGQRLDDTGLYYYNARYYDATIGRFISPDTIVPDWTNPQSFNRYSYVTNNPLRYTDPSGHGGPGKTDLKVSWSFGRQQVYYEGSKYSNASLAYHEWFAGLTGAGYRAGAIDVQYGSKQFNVGANALTTEVTLSLKEGIQFGASLADASVNLGGVDVSIGIQLKFGVGKKMALGPISVNFAGFIDNLAGWLSGGQYVQSEYEYMMGEFMAFNKDAPTNSITPPYNYTMQVWLQGYEQFKLDSTIAEYGAANFMQEIGYETTAHHGIAGVEPAVIIGSGIAQDVNGDWMFYNEESNEWT